MQHGRGEMTEAEMRRMMRSKMMRAKKTKTTASKRRFVPKAKRKQR